MGEDTLKQYTITDGHTLAYRSRYLRPGDTIRLDDESLAAFSAEVRARFVEIKAEIDASAGEADRAFDGVSDEGRPAPPAKSENKPVHVAYAIDILKLPKAEVNELSKDALIALITKTIEEADAAA